MVEIIEERVKFKNKFLKLFILKPQNLLLNKLQRKQMTAGIMKSNKRKKNSLKKMNRMKKMITEDEVEEIEDETKRKIRRMIILT